MEFRKLINFGKTSHVVSIPKTWLLKNKLNKGDSVSLQEVDGSLVLSPNTGQAKKEVKEIVINVDNKDKNQLQREVASSYINNYNPIILTGKELKQKSVSVKNIAKNLIALEIMQQTSNRMIAKDFLSMDKVSIPSLLRKMDIIARDMIVDTKKCFEEDHYESIYSRDDDVNRLSFLIFRAVKTALKEPDIFRAYKASTYGLMTDWFVNVHLEKVADHVKRIARNIKIMKKDKVMPKNVKILLELFDVVEKRYLETMKCYHNNDLNLAYNLAATKREMLNKCADVSIKHKKYDVWVDTVDKIKQMVADLHDITRTVYLFLLENDEKAKGLKIN